MKIKQVFAHCGRDGYSIEGPLNAFIETLPKKGREITKITYVMSNHKLADVKAAIVEYEEQDNEEDSPSLEEEMTPQFEKLIAGHADYRRNDVARGIESPYFAALLTWQYAQGVADAARALFNSPRTHLYILADSEAQKTDPDFHQHTKERYHSFADITMSERVKHCECDPNKP